MGISVHLMEMETYYTLVQIFESFNYIEWNERKMNNKLGEPI